MSNYMNSYLFLTCFLTNIIHNKCNAYYYFDFRVTPDYFNIFGINLLDFIVLPYYNKAIDTQFVVYLKNGFLYLVLLGGLICRVI